MSEKRIDISEDVWQYYDKLVEQARRKCFDEDKAKDAVVEVFDKIASGQIDLSDIKDPYAYLVHCVQNQALSNYRKLKAKGRRFDIQNRVLVEGNETIEGMAADVVSKKKTGLQRERPKSSTYNGKKANDFD